VLAPQPPLHLVLGKPGLELVRGKLERLNSDLDTWQERTLWADNPLG
jgi:hypothetical protein